MLTYRQDGEKGKYVKLKVIFKSNGREWDIDRVKTFAMVGNRERVLRIDMEDGKAHFINFSEVLACLQCVDDEDSTTT